MMRTKRGLSCNARKFANGVCNYAEITRCLARPAFENHMGVWKFSRGAPI